MITELNERTQEILRHIVDTYLMTGEPIGSSTLSNALNLGVSPATIRNIMAKLETDGLLYSPHTSAGRLPTHRGLRLYVDGLMEVGNLTEEEEERIASECLSAGRSLPSVLEQATSMLSGLSDAAGLVVAPKTEKPIQHIQFMRLDAYRALLIVVMESGMVENRIVELSPEITDSALVEASNYLNHHTNGKTLTEARSELSKDIDTLKSQLSGVTAGLVSSGVIETISTEGEAHLIIRGQSNLLNDIKAIEDLEKAKDLIASLEQQDVIMDLLEASQDAEGVQIFIGTENKIFDHTGWSMMLSPYRDRNKQIVGAVGVVGPSRINYGRIISILDYTTKVMENLLDS